MGKWKKKRRRTAPNFSLTSAKLSVGSTCRKIVCDLRLTRTYCEQVLEDIEGRSTSKCYEVIMEFSMDGEKGVGFPVGGISVLD